MGGRDHDTLVTSALKGRRRLGEGGGDMHARLAPLWDMASRVAVNGSVVIVSANAGESPMQASRVACVLRMLSHRF
ncbi:unnamed protein product, partial [Closterium sp. Naga37s-1]